MKEYYREFTCIVCGAKAIDRGTRQDARFCGTKCRDYAYRRDYKVVYNNPCKYNDGVFCLDHKCEGCGWNPDVQKARKKDMGVDYGEE